MSWKEDLQRTLEVFMGDGKSFFPLWKNAVKEVNYNISQFNFPGVEGTLVRRREMRNREFDITFYFIDTDKADHLEIAKDFEESAKDNRHWHIRHPYYGDIRCQPSQLKFDNRGHGVTIVTGRVIETILGVAPITLDNPTAALKIKLDIQNDISNRKYLNTTPDVQPVLISFMTERLLSFTDTYKPAITNEKEARDFLSLVAEAKSGIADFTNKGLFTLRKMQAVAQFPINTANSIFERFRYINEEIRRTRTALFGLQNIPSSLKRMYEKTMSDLYSALFLSVIPSPQSNSSSVINTLFATASQMSSIALRMSDSWDDLVNDLDTLQDINYSTGDNYVQDNDILINLEDLFTDSLSSLQEIISSSKTEIKIYLEEDSNPIVLTHRFYGLDVNDENLKLFIESNNLSLLEQIYIEKDREIIYYV